MDSSKLVFYKGLLEGGRRGVLLYDVGACAGGVGPFLSSSIA